MILGRDVDEELDPLFPRNDAEEFDRRDADEFDQNDADADEFDYLLSPNGARNDGFMPYDTSGDSVGNIPVNGEISDADGGGSDDPRDGDWRPNGRDGGSSSDTDAGSTGKRARVQNGKGTGRTKSKGIHKPKSNGKPRDSHHPEIAFATLFFKTASNGDYRGIVVNPTQYAVKLGEMQKNHYGNATINSLSSMSPVLLCIAMIRYFVNRPRSGVPDMVRFCETVFNYFTKATVAAVRRIESVAQIYNEIRSYAQWHSGAWTHKDKIVPVMQYDIFCMLQRNSGDDDDQIAHDLRKLVLQYLLPSYFDNGKEVRGFEVPTKSVNFNQGKVRNGSSTCNWLNCLGKVETAAPMLTFVSVDATAANNTNPNDPEHKGLDKDTSMLVVFELSLGAGSIIKPVDSVAAAAEGGPMAAPDVAAEP